MPPGDPAPNPDDDGNDDHGDDGDGGSIVGNLGNDEGVVWEWVDQCCQLRFLDATRQTFKKR